MLIRFKVSNFLSIYKEQEFCLFPSRVKSHEKHLFKTKTTLTNILKSAIIYGANSSGKSNLLKAISFAQNYIVNGSASKQFINVSTFKLIKQDSSPSKFVFEIYINGKCFEYGFVIKKRLVSKEWLKRVYKSSEKTVFLREVIKGKSKLPIKPKIKDKNNNLVFEVTSLELKNNQLLLTVLNSKNPEAIEDEYKKVFNWFSNQLKVIFPYSKNIGIQLRIMKNIEIKAFFEKYLKILDTGIDGIDFHPYDFNDANVTIPQEIKNEIENKLDDDKQIIAVSSDRNDNYCIQRKGNKLIAYKLKAIHKIFSQKERMEFDFSEESDGTNRIFDITPTLYAMFNSDSVIFIDEIDRSLHSLIPSKMFELFFNETVNKQAQFIATTHDLTLLDLSKFRRDEIWFIKKDYKLQSILYSLEEYKERYDKELRKTYLAGNYGAVPIFSNIYEEK
jgi:AAA15 family ATPase/GTPase